MNTAIFEIIMFSPILIAISLIILLFFILLYYFIKIINIFLIKLFHIDKKLMDKIHIISFVSINILISTYFLITLLYNINTYGTDLNTFIDKDNQVYLGNIIFTFSLVLENIIISIICIFYKNINISFKLFRNGF
ncbi:hypothetical protein SZ53_09620 [Brachyspira hyodysenteriae]|uniref:Uncharacterized protein n=2 Tax=Brachyspira hyodysenteriae TaxID=159 RepID=A0A3B6VEY7_BRAHW|nr:hypothetical protein BHWA1_02449 [Brachyspira hyodysenteriae WA1]KLI29287.1 hypothetical protein SZ49_10540 [Brachyspira hyodysenteriae]KLI39289.1 hypothetical protein SZ53_09620 [Brachyspira hyodysenteriae]KLI42840.1 hypothetical protein SZ40_09380 [Brachyspira hyodysenteriae]KLI44126.1 hypothetical protein SZ52_02210 [Brachyspira hyodysenteriae]